MKTYLPGKRPVLSKKAQDNPKIQPVPYIGERDSYPPFVVFAWDFCLRIMCWRNIEVAYFLLKVDAVRFVEHYTAEAVIPLPKKRPLEIGDLVSYNDSPAYVVSLDRSKKSVEIEMDDDIGLSYEMELMSSMVPCKTIKVGTFPAQS